MNNKIQFADLHTYNDSNSFVWTALTFNPNEMKDIESFLKEIGFMLADANILEMKIIDGNIKGAEGRTDVLFITSPTFFNPMVRLRVDGLKWTSDFFVNFANDYGFPEKEFQTVDNEY